MIPERLQVALAPVDRSLLRAFPVDETLCFTDLLRAIDLAERSSKEPRHESHAP